MPALLYIRRADAVPSVLVAKSPPALFAALYLLLVANTLHAEAKFEAYYRSDLLYNSRGGLDEGFAHLDDAGLRAEMRFGSSSEDAVARAFVYLLWNNGATFSDRYSGDLQSVSNIESSQALRIFELWYEQPLSDRLSLRLGLYDLNSEFDSIDTATMFINGSHGMGADFGQSGENGPSVFPTSSLAARFAWRVSETSRLRYAVLDGVPGDPEHPGRTAVDLGGDDGLLHALEYVRSWPGHVRTGIGGWLYSSDFELFDWSGAGAPLTDDGNSGIYGFVDLPLVTTPGSAHGLAAFLRYGIADDRFNVFDSYIGAGLVFSGLLSSRPEDRLGLAIASARTGGPYRRAAEARGSMTSAHETSIEVTYRARIRQGFWLQPQLQYLVTPGADRRLDNALVYGLRFEFATYR